ncbi:hypothetical protein [Aeromicrobium endophyticum]|uniref:hypothetical protein n=1 Tax=Aeromicrobium endophyticum TaxID=2292704 RepID=UPI0011C3749B|nr:hypothetical protein [Aeromicrobium endophyticum]
MTNWWSNLSPPEQAVRPRTVSVRTLSQAIENTLMDAFSHEALAVILPDEVGLRWMVPDATPADADTKRTLIKGYVAGTEVPGLIALARRILTELEVSPQLLRPLLAEYDRGGGVGSPAKNLIFAANGPKPELVLRDAVSNDIEIVRNAEHCLVYELEVPVDGLKFQHLIDWWRSHEGLPDELDDRAVGHRLHARLRASLAGNGAEELVFDAYAARYRAHSFNIPALIPQVYLHYDPYTARSRASRGESDVPLARQRMDFLILFSDKHRVVLEVDGRQHYADADGKANTRLYAEMVAEDRRLRLAGYEVYRFGGQELAHPGAGAMLAAFFDKLADRMK